MGQKTPAVVKRDIEDGDLPGTVAFEADDKGLFYVCPCGCGREGFLYFRGRVDKGPSWDWDGNRVAPTLAPSILKHELDVNGNKVGQHWHGYLRAGVWESC